MAIPIPDTLAPDGVFPVAVGSDVKGGFYPVADATARDAIPASYKTNQMIVRLQDTGLFYEWTGSAWAVIYPPLTASNGITYTQVTGLISASQNLATNGAPSFSSLTVTKSDASNTVAATISQTDNTSSSSHARLYVQTGGSSGGDPSITFTVDSATDWSLGIRNASGDALEERPGLGLGTGTTRRVTTAGEQTMPLQPAFAAFKSSSSNNVTGNGTRYTIICDTEIKDQNGDYNATTGVFTAPVTGLYHIDIGVVCVGGTALTNFSDLQLVTSNSSYATYLTTILAGSYAATYSALVEMDAGDTAYPTVAVTDSAGLAVDVFGTGNYQTYFTGFLAC